MEIKAGELVRTNKGKIFKVTEVNQTLGKEIAIVKNEYGYPRRIDLTEEKHSFNIIDLIEVGDYVNGERILDITGDYIHTNETDHNRFYLAKHIKTILTKEQYQANYYIVERKE